MQHENDESERMIIGSIMTGDNAQSGAGLMLNMAQIVPKRRSQPSKTLKDHGTPFGYQNSQVICELCVLGI